ncbi:Fungal transcriptional regulatory protein [Rutstroemia sp. NJR-2017a BBW]|nr:Fungal transcriptional regulatory protein [Rutstroemia sp. NJR-2017a BBW]
MSLNLSKLLQVPVRNKRSRIRTLLSCTECHRRKQKCNRKSPCNDCLERGVPHKCLFEKPLRQRHYPSESKSAQDARMRRILTGEEILLSTESVDDLQHSASLTTYDEACMVTVDDMHFLDPLRWTDKMYMLGSSPSLEDSIGFDLKPRHQVGGFDPFSALPEKSGEPIHKSILIEYFLRKLAPWLSHCDDEQLPNAPAYSWLPFALHHPPLFYATLLSAAVHLDRIQPMDKQILLWYKVETIRLANEKLNIPDEGVADQMLIVVLVLLYFNSAMARGNLIGIMDYSRNFTASSKKIGGKAR